MYESNNTIRSSSLLLELLKEELKPIILDFSYYKSKPILSKKSSILKPISNTKEYFEQRLITGIKRKLKNNDTGICILIIINAIKLYFKQFFF
jgi:hypothetical protein